MIVGYVALTELTAEAELVVYYGNTQCQEMMFSGRFKLHLIPADITYLSLITRNFITGNLEPETILSLPEALKSGFMRPVELHDASMSIRDIPPLIPRKRKSKK